MTTRLSTKCNRYHSKFKKAQFFHWKFKNASPLSEVLHITEKSIALSIEMVTVHTPTKNWSSGSLFFIALSLNSSFVHFTIEWNIMPKCLLLDVMCYKFELNVWFSHSKIHRKETIFSTIIYFCSEKKILWHISFILEVDKSYGVCCFILRYKCVIRVFCCSYCFCCRVGGCCSFYHNAHKWKNTSYPSVLFIQLHCWREEKKTQRETKEKNPKWYIGYENERSEY